MSICLIAYHGNHTTKFHNIFCMLPVTVAQSSSDDNVYIILLVLKLTSCFHIIEGIGQNQRQHVSLISLGDFAPERSLPSPMASLYCTGLRLGTVSGTAWSNTAVITTVSTMQVYRINDYGKFSYPSS